MKSPAPKATTTKNKKLKTRQWSHDETMKLINLWGSENCLYNAQSDNYRDKNKRMNAITRIVNELAELDIIVHNDDVSAKLHSLRVYYSATRNKHEASKNKSGSGQDV